MKSQPLQPSYQRCLNYRQFMRSAVGTVKSGAASGLLWGVLTVLGAGALGSVELLSPQTVYAYTAEDLLTVNWVAGEDYTALARRAEEAARTMAQQRFDSDILLTRVLITVLGQNGGQTAPILLMDVARPDWRNRPDPRYWSKYYRSTPALLGLEGVAPTGTLQAPSPPDQSAPPALPPAAQPSETAPLTPPATSPEAAPATPQAAPEPAPALTSPTRPSSTRRSPGRSVQNQRTQTAPSLSPAPDPGPNVVPASPQPTTEVNPSAGQPQTNQPPINLPAVPAGVGIPDSLR